VALPHAVSVVLVKETRRTLAKVDPGLLNLQTPQRPQKVLHRNGKIAYIVVMASRKLNH
jgi:hypothetical protein